ncbi:MAG: ATP-dependent DNA helicase RecG [Anaerolineaceae bacterium]|nr:ATP-dependent DNA helicase RecG [Anaerolineaceae bacterium]
MIISPVEKLRRFLKLELSRSCDNRAVVGGMGKFLPIWQKESATAGISAELNEKVTLFLNSYGEKNPDERKTAVTDIMILLPPPDANPQREQRQRYPRQEPSNSRQPNTESTEGKTQEHRSFNARAVPTRKEEQVGRKHRPEPVINTEDRYREPGPTTRPEKTTSPADPAEKPIIQEKTETIWIRHDPYTQPAGPSVQFLRERFGHPQINPKGPSIDSPVSEIPGIGFSNSKALAKQDVYTVRDFLYYFPRRYDDYSSFKAINKVQPDEIVTIIGVVKSVTGGQRGRYQITEIVVADGTGMMRVTWFNRAWLSHQIFVGMGIVLSGKIDVFLGRPVMTNPEWEPAEHDNITTNRIVPIYALNQNLKQNFLRRMMYNTVRHWTGQLPETLPDSVLESANLLPLQLAISNIHFPESREHLRYARERLAFDEIFFMQLSVLSQKQEWSGLPAEPFEVSDELFEKEWLSNLPFELTNAQKAALADIRKDMASGHPMNRLVQGDVGSGKTIVASLASLIVMQKDGQAAIMAPTGVLAEQHYRSFIRFLEGLGEHAPITADQVELMVGATPDSRKQEIRERLESGSVRVLIGTHALIEEPVRFKNLQLAVIDEQHRFGVDQRAALRAKGTNPHLLVMTATPIPRSLSLTIYGDLDLTLIDELPAGRKPIRTVIVPPVLHEKVYGWIRREISNGHQAFIIFPLVEEGDDEEKEGRAAIEGSEFLQTQVFPDLRVALLHGRMKGSEKDTILEAFKNHEYDILVSTSVIEVGVDVPNATVMVIEGANHFGLAQLHQFRGRVGRGDSQSWCALIPDKDNDLENQRLNAMAETNDGFRLAEMDLEMRGPGDFIGKRQSGLREMKLASMSDVRLIEKARNEAAKIFEDDPELSKPENSILKARVIETISAQRKGEIS